MPPSPFISPRGLDTRRRLFAFERNAVVRAGAGTGKTEALATVYLHLAGGLASPDVWPRGGLAPERIVALTFTEKAAREMRERIAEAVELLAAERLPRELESPDDVTRAEAAARWASMRGLSQAVVARVLALADSAVRNGRPLPAPELWQRIAWSLGSAQIGTFHGFAAGVLRRAGVDLGLDPAFQVLDQEAAELLLRGAVLQSLAEHAQRDVTAVVELMSASGGLGERAERGLITALSNLVHGLDEDGLRADTLQVSSAVDPTDMRAYIAADTLRRLGDACETVPALRDDGSAERVRALSHAVESLPAMTSADLALDRMRRLRGLGALPPRNRTRRLEPLATEAREALDALRQDAVAQVSRHLAEVARGILASTQRAYERAKKQRAALDFSDLMRLLRDALRDRTALRREWKHRYDAVLVDEFQDTNRVQRDLLYLLRERRDVERMLAPGQSLVAGELEPSGLLVVGDAKQSIYAFRGADVAVFLATEAEIGDAGGARLELADSFRAVEALLDAVNPVTETLLGPGATRIEGLYDPSRDRLTAVARGDDRARVELLLVPEGRADEQRRTEAEAIARRIAELASGAHETPGWRAPRMDEVAVLVPSWSHLEPIKRALQSRGIPYALRGGPGFWERREVDDLVTLLRFVADPSDRLSLAALLRGPLVGLSDAGLANLFARASSLEDMLDPPQSLRATLEPDDQARLDEARPSLRRLVRFGPTLGPFGVLRQVLAERAFAAVLARLPFGAQRVANVDKLLGLAAAAESREGDESDLHGFLRYVDRMRAAAQRESEADITDASTGSVQVMSIHAAKGLEWPVVFVAQTSRRKPAKSDRMLRGADGALRVLPGGVETPEAFAVTRRAAYAAEEDDARRLLYVALTRARDLLVVSGPDAPGEGEWAALRTALEREAPFRVRVRRAGEVGEAVPVRTRSEPGDDVEVPAVPAAVVRSPTRRSLTLLAGALQDHAWCARRFHAIHELGLREHGASQGDVAATSALLRRVLGESDPAQWHEAPDACLDAVCASTGVRRGAPSAESVRAMLRRFARTPLSRALAEHPELVAGKALPFATRVESGEVSVTLTGEMDLLLRGEAVGRTGVVVVRVGVGAEHDEGEVPGGVSGVDAALGLLVARRALRRRFAEEARVEVDVHAAVLTFAEEAQPTLVFVHAPDDSAVEARAVELVATLDAARRDARWDGRPRYVCEALRCGFIARCHG